MEEVEDLPSAITASAECGGKHQLDRVMLQSGSITGGEPGSCTSRKIVGQRSTVNLNWNPGTLTCIDWKDYGGREGTVLQNPFWV